MVTFLGLKIICVLKMRFLKTPCTCYGLDNIGKTKGYSAPDHLQAQAQPMILNLHCLLHTPR